MNLIKTTPSFLRWTLLAGLVFPLAAQAATVTGTVTNKTTGRPDTTDTVVLLSLSNGMQQVATAKPNAQGHFSINLPDSSMHLIRVDHQKASYYAAVPPGTKHVNVTVYDVAAKVPGVKTTDDVLQIEADSQGLHVLEYYFVENNSKPARTQFSSEAYPIYLPTKAQVQGAQAEGPAGMPVSVSPVPLAGKGHYAFVFPLRPGKTRFAISYLIPYSGSFQFNTKVGLRTDDYAVILPNSMSFKSPGESGFEQVQDKKMAAQTFVTRNVTPGKTLTFTVSGTGSMPREAQSGNQSQSAGGGSSQASGSSQNDRPGIGLGRPIDTPGPLHKYRWWIVSALGLILVVVAAFLLGGKKTTEGEADTEPENAALIPTAGSPAAKAAAGTGAGQVSKPSSPGAAGQAAGSSGLLLNALKEELFALETEHAEGKIGEEEYAELKNALGIVLRRALNRKS